MGPIGQGGVADAKGADGLPEPRPGAISAPITGGAMADVIGFYFPGRNEPCDSFCGAPFLGNFWPLGPNGLELEAPCQPQVQRHFRNAEAAFQALKFWDRAGEFSHLEGLQAFHKKKQLAGLEDWTYGGNANSWRAMLSVLYAKFVPQSAMAQALMRTGDAFLLEHNSVAGRDKIWSDNFDGEGMNLLGMQLMLLRDELRNRSGDEGQWTAFICSLIDPHTGKPWSSRQENEWRTAVRAASKAVRDAVDNRS